MKRLTGLKAVVGKRLTEIFPAVKDETPDILGIYRRVAECGEPTDELPNDLLRRADEALHAAKRHRRRFRGRSRLTSRLPRMRSADRRSGPHGVYSSSISPEYRRRNSCRRSFRVWESSRPMRNSSTHRRTRCTRS